MKTVIKASLLASLLAGSLLAATSLSARPEGMPPRPAPETVVVDMFTNYDADESDTLSQDELIAALQGIREAHRKNFKGKRPGFKRPMDGDMKDRPERPRKDKRRGPPSPEKLAPKLIEDFDTTDDAELNTEELLNAIKELHSRGARGRKPAGDEQV